ncbi:ORF4 [Chimpanzee stool associated circular ssDNA virus]|nr:ORF4 [Chimpanzee stool associated circular ssDNA virus]
MTRAFPPMTSQAGSGDVTHIVDVSIGIVHFLLSMIHHGNSTESLEREVVVNHEPVILLSLVRRRKHDHPHEDFRNGILLNHIIRILRINQEIGNLIHGRDNSTLCSSIGRISSEPSNSRLSLKPSKRPKSIGHELDTISSRPKLRDIRIRSSRKLLVPGVPIRKPTELKITGDKTIIIGIDIISSIRRLNRSIFDLRIAINMFGSTQEITGLNREIIIIILLRKMLPNTERDIHRKIVNHRPKTRLFQTSHRMGLLPSVIRHRLVVQSFHHLNLTIEKGLLSRIRISTIHPKPRIVPSRGSLTSSRTVIKGIQNHAHIIAMATVKENRIEQIARVNLRFPRVISDAERVNRETSRRDESKRASIIPHLSELVPKSLKHINRGTRTRSVQTDNRDSIGFSIQVNDFLIRSLCKIRSSHFTTF